MTSPSRIVRNTNGALCLHWVSGAVWLSGARDINISTSSVSERWLADFRSRVESLALARSPFVAHNEATQTCSSCRHVEKMNERKRAEQPLYYMQRISYMILSPAHNQSRSFQSQMQSKKNYVWQLFTRNQHTRSQLFECTQLYDD
jgi:hypothetical protein